MLVLTPAEWLERFAGGQTGKDDNIERLARKAPHIARDIFDKVEWLAENADVIKHERLKGRREFSLHCGQYRLPYLWDRETGIIVIIALIVLLKVFRSRQQ